MSGPDILREVEESMRAEKAAKFWKENGNIILFIVAAIILGTTAQSIWTSYKKGQDEVSTSQFLDAIKDKEPVAALQKLTKDGKGAGSALAGLNTASMLIEKKDWKGAIESYQNVIGNKTIAKPYKDLASLQLAMLQLDHDERINGADLLKLLEPIIQDKDSAWKSKALFVSALVKAQKNNDYKSAIGDLESLLGQTNLAPSFLEQIQSLLEVYKMKSGS